MKIRSIVSIAAIAAIGIIGTNLSTRSVKADAAPRKHEYITIQANEFYQTVDVNGVTKQRFGGLYVYNYDASAGAPKLDLPYQEDPFGVTTNLLDQVLADLDAKGYEIINNNGRMISLRSR